MVRDPRRFAKLYGGVHLHMRTCVRADVPLLYLGISWTDLAEIWHVVSDPLARLFAKVESGTQLHVRTRLAPFWLFDGIFPIHSGMLIPILSSKMHTSKYFCPHRPKNDFEKMEFCGIFLQSGYIAIVTPIFHMW